MKKCIFKLLHPIFFLALIYASNCFSQAIPAAAQGLKEELISVDLTGDLPGEFRAN